MIKMQYCENLLGYFQEKFPLMIEDVKKYDQQVSNIEDHANASKDFKRLDDPIIHKLFV